MGRPGLLALGVSVLFFGQNQKSTDEARVHVIVLLEFFTGCDFASFFSEIHDDG